MKISRVLHAGYLFETAGSVLLFDPIFEAPFSRNCYPFPDVEFDRNAIRELRADAVFISHFHDDHCSLESLNLLDRKIPIYMFSLFDEFLHLIRDLGFKNVHSLELDQPVHVGPFEVIPRRALDEDVDSIFHIRADGLNVLNVVDAWIHPETLNRLAETKRWDLVLWPFQTMRELEVLTPSRAAPTPPGILPEWREPLTRLAPRFLVPSSCQFRHEEWSWYNHALFPVTYREFEMDLAEVLPKTQVVRMNPGVGVELSAQGIAFVEALDWVQPIGEQNVDYEYRPQLVPATSGEIARRFTPLTAAQRACVTEFCESGLVLKMQECAEPTGPYFRDDVFWRLTIYDSEGAGQDFDYNLRGSRAQRVSFTPEMISWWTEISTAKLFAALEQGESLTSMYLRINDRRFSNEVESRLTDVDVMEDPLIRCLFNGDVAAYQRAQLLRIRERENANGLDNRVRAEHTATGGSMNNVLYDFAVKKIDGANAKMKDYEGKVLLIVNVASKCGLTPQYDALEKIYERYHAKGFEVLAFPANEFGAQEPGTNAEIQEFCQTKFGVKFPMFDKIVVKGPGQNPLYKYLTETKPEAQMKPGPSFEEKLKAHGIAREKKNDILWNFEKFLVNRKGEVVARFAPDITPDDAMITKAIEANL